MQSTDAALVGSKPPSTAHEQAGRREDQKDGIDNRETGHRAAQSCGAGNAHELLSRQQIDEQYGQGDGKLKRWLELAALRGGGPPYSKISHRMVRYQRAKFEDWLDQCTIRSTSEQVAA